MKTKQRVRLLPTIKVHNNLKQLKEIQKMEYLGGGKVRENIQECYNSHNPTLPMEGVNTLF